MAKDTAEAKKPRTKSQIPRAPKSTSESKSQPAESHPDDSTIDKSEYIRESLLKLGAPRISPEEMRRLCKGPLGDALFFMAEHMQGRAEVNKVRATIQQYVVFTHFIIYHITIFAM